MQNHKKYSTQAEASTAPRNLKQGDSGALFSYPNSEEGSG